MTAPRAVQPDGWAAPRGYANGILASGKLLFVAGQVGWDEQSQFQSEDFVEQTRQALRNIVAVVATAGGQPAHIVRLTWYVVDKQEYLARRRDVGRAYRDIIGEHYPAMSLVEVSSLLEDVARVEIEATAVIPDASESAT